MPFDLTIPQASGASLGLSLDPGEQLFILGANGTGKSTLMHRLYSQYVDSARRISAHRQTWFSTNASSLSAQDRRSLGINIRNNDTNPEARWKEFYSEHRASLAIFDVIDVENTRARKIADAFGAGDLERATELSKKDGPITIINELLSLSNIPISISLPETEELLASKRGSVPYSIAELSDGERNAIIIAANVLTVNANTLILIDEPERHLHRSIIAPLLTLLFAKRPDCAFVVSTHEVMLPLDSPGARTLLIRDCTFVGSAVTGWSADLIESVEGIDDDLKKDILGARKKILFIEGTEQSLDKPLYTIIFPNVTVVAKSSCRDVEHAVSGIRGAASLHWLHAFGIVDNDRRSQSDIDRLKENGIYALPVFSVESIYYHPNVQHLVAARHASVTGEDSASRLDNAKSAALAVIRRDIQRMSERATEKTIREEIYRYLPKRQDIAAAAPIDISIDIPAIVAGERAQLQAALDEGDLLFVISQYPIRETSALAEIARRLGFQGKEQYEGAVRKLLLDDDGALSFVRSLFGTLPDDIDRA